MNTNDPRPRLGMYRLIRPLDAHPMADRWLALHEGNQTSHIIYKFAHLSDRTHIRRFAGAIERLMAIGHPHVLPVEEFALGMAQDQRPWLVCPYPGTVDGLVTLEQLLNDRGGPLPVLEVQRLTSQLFEAMIAMQAQSVCHGVITADQVLVDRHGSLAVELYGLKAASQGQSCSRELIRDEVRSVVQLVYRALTGQPGDEPRIRADRLVRKIPSHWAAWFDQGLDELRGFDDARQALDVFTNPVIEEKPIVRTVLKRMRSALWVGSSV